MKTTINIRKFPVMLEDIRNKKIIGDSIFLTKQHLQAAQLVGESSKELINRIYNRRGYKVLTIEKPEKKEITVDLEELYIRDLYQDQEIKELNEL